MLVNSLTPYVEIVNLPLDFSKEELMPQSLGEFEEIISSEAFKF
jgi:hypothetical protein